MATNHSLSALILLSWISCSSAHAANLVIHGEIHDSETCTDQRQALAEAASLGSSFFFTENAFTPEWTDDWSKQIAGNLLGSVPYSTRVQGLESPSSWSIGLYYHTQANFDRLKTAAFEKLAQPNDPRSLATRHANLNKARSWIDLLLSDSGICENEPVRSIFCSGIQYDSDVAFSYRGDDLAQFVIGPASEMLVRFGQSVRKQMQNLHQQTGIPTQVLDPRERNWVQAAPGKQNSPGEVDYQIIWRNYIMEKNLSQALQTHDPRATQDAHVVLGAAHVRHFYETFQRDYPQIAARYRIQVRFECMRAELQKHFSWMNEN